ncbi:MAG: hypothetical protein Fues2KO_17060 [Fuerstiella sp.]
MGVHKIIVDREAKNSDVHVVDIDNVYTQLDIGTGLYFANRMIGQFGDKPQPRGIC